MTADDTFELAARVIQKALDAGCSLGTAESCTGGLVAAALTSIPGSSAVYKGGVVSYANEVKEGTLGVPSQVLADKGAVSVETASYMAFGACKLLDVDLAVSITGIAGPGGGTEEKPIGLVCFGRCYKGDVTTDVQRFSGDRDQVRASAVLYALALMEDALS